MNPPYKKSLHLAFLLNMIPLAKLMAIIQPSTWLISLKTSGKYTLYKSLKDMLSKHVSKVILENYNKAFNIALFVPLSITYIDNVKTYDTITFESCGEVSNVKSLNDCNLIGKWDLVQSILSKCKAYGDLMCDHMTNEMISDKQCYLPFSTILPLHPAWAESDFVNMPELGLYRNYISNMIHKYERTPKSNIPTNANGNMFMCTYGTEQELENWKHFALHSHLALFICISMTTDLHNNAMFYLPWIVDKTYTDEELYNMFLLSDLEISLIESTIRRYDRNSTWFRRYLDIK